MTNCVGPFDGGFSAKFVIHDNMRAFENIVYGFESIVAVATTEPTGEVHVQFVSTHHASWPDLLLGANGVESVFLPLYILRGEECPPPGTVPPKIIR
jgi:hypothetical protein